MDEQAKMEFCRRMGFPYTPPAEKKTTLRVTSCKREGCENPLGNSSKQGYCSVTCFRYKHKAKICRFSDVKPVQNT